jgi:hypothetical protein
MKAMWNMRIRLRQRSAAVSRWAARTPSAEARTLAWLSGAHRGRPVVPEVVSR